MRKLFILGNGFDLTIGLNSKYSDFYNKYVSTYKSDYSKVSFWELLLGDINDSQNNWIDIETEIEQMLIEINSENVLNLTVKEITNRIRYIVERDDNDIINNKDTNMMYKKILFIKREEIQLFLEYFIENAEDKQNNEEMIFSDFLSDQLVLLQEHFNDYMEEELKKFNLKAKRYSFLPTRKEYLAMNYNDTALNLLYKLNDSKNFNDISVLNFNYTYFDNNDNRNGYNGKINMLNIHGDLDKKDIIIGADLKIINEGNELIPFTKPFKIVNNVNKNFGILKSNRELDNIIFYGHSLGDTDFNYFKSIFDAVDLYGGNINLTFYIPIFNQNIKTKIISEHESNILNLLTKYSKTLNNIKEDDVSLFTKLLLEGRLHIQKLDYREYERYNLKLCEERREKRDMERIREKEIEMDRREISRAREREI